VRSIISVLGLTRTYASGFKALRNVSLEIRRGEIFALLGPNGAGTSTLINIICGIVNPTSGVILAEGHDLVRDSRAARSRIGLVPQELSTDMFETVWATVNFRRGLFNPVVYLISSFCWNFYGISDLGAGVSLGMLLDFLAVCLTVVWWIFRAGYRLKN
jgi:ABC-2 type transport system ATP-binding protein